MKKIMKNYKNQFLFKNNIFTKKKLKTVMYKHTKKILMQGS
jgi:hypothetical protein